MVNRNVRLNNPGNIEKGIRWNGLSPDQPDARFAKFVTPEYGFRAMARILLTYNKRYRTNTVDGIIGRWAPEHENDTAAYADFVRIKSGVDNYVRRAADYPPVMAAMAQFEGWGFYDIVRAKAGYQLA